MGDENKPEQQTPKQLQTTAHVAGEPVKVEPAKANNEEKKLEQQQEVSRIKEAFRTESKEEEIKLENQHEEKKDEEKKEEEKKEDEKKAEEKKEDDKKSEEKKEEATQEQQKEQQVQKDEKSQQHQQQQEQPKKDQVGDQSQQQQDSSTLIASIPTSDVSITTAEKPSAAPSPPEAIKLKQENELLKNRIKALEAKAQAKQTPAPAAAASGQQRRKGTGSIELSHGTHFFFFVLVAGTVFVGLLVAIQKLVLDAKTAKAAAPIASMLASSPI